MIGLYDSGIGGLNIYKKLSELIDTGKIVYYADYENAPLGDKSIDQIKKSTSDACEYLFENGCSVILLACNTATAAAIRYIQNEWLPQYYHGRKVLGIIRPITEGLTELNTPINNNILVLSTETTHKTGFYLEELNTAGFNNVYSVGIAGLAEAIEKQDESMIDKILNDLFANIDNIEKYDNLVLACTHYPLVVDRIKDIFVQKGGKVDIKILDQSQIVVGKFMDYLHKHKGEIVLSDLGGIFFVNGDPDDFERKLGKIFDIYGYVLQV